MKCPRDSQALVFVDDGRHMRDRCPGCEGVLLDRDEVMGALGRGVGKAGLSRAELAKLAASSLACPREGATMRQLMHGEVELDICPECNALWVDPGELDKIVRKKPAGKGKKAAVAAGALAAAATPERQSLVSGLGEAVAEIAAEGAIDLVFDFAVEAIGALFS